MLRIHDELGLRAVAPEIFKMSLLLFLRGEKQLDSLFQRSDGAGLMVHDFLDLPAIGQKGIEPDLAGFEGRDPLLRFLRVSESIDPRSREGIDLGQFARLRAPA